jgi:hypothetical protein
MDKAKIRLSPSEAELVSNPSWILTKNGIILKIKSMLEYLQSKQQDFLLHNSKTLPTEIIHVPPKISKGENYNGLPYLILDHPRHFQKEGTLAIRSMFWWGHFFSTTLHLSGHYKTLYQEKIVSNLDSFQNDFYICIHNEEWEHHFEENNYRKINSMNREELIELINSKDFLKLARKYPLQQFEIVDEFLFETFTVFVKSLKD